MGHLFGACREEGAKSHIIRACLPRFHRKVAAIVARHPNLRLTSQNLSRLTRIAIVLPQMDAIGTQSFGKSNAVIDDEGDIVVSANSLKRLGRARNRVVVQPLQPQLKGSDWPGVQCSFQPICKAIINLRGGKEVEFRRFTVFSSKSFGKALRHFWQVKIIHAQRYRRGSREAVAL